MFLFHFILLWNLCFKKYIYIYMCVYICMCVYIYVCMYIYMYTSICIHHIYMYTPHQLVSIYVVYSSLSSCWTFLLCFRCVSKTATRFFFFLSDYLLLGEFNPSAFVDLINILGFIYTILLCFLSCLLCFLTAFMFFVLFCLLSDWLSLFCFSISSTSL